MKNHAVIFFETLARFKLKKARFYLSCDLPYILIRPYLIRLVLLIQEPNYLRGILSHEAYD